MPHFSRQARGFALPEILMVLGSTAVLIALLIPSPWRHGFIDGQIEGTAGAKHPFVLWVPHDYSYHGERSYPLLLYLHGASNYDLVKKVGLGPAIQKKEKEFDFFVLFPRIKGSWFDKSDEARAVIPILEHVEAEYRIDTRRVYLTGISAGGAATWRFAAEHPKRWAAIVPVSGYPQLSLAPRISHLPCWCFYGGADGGSIPEASREMIEALRASGGKPKVTELKDHSHNVWDDAYAMPELYDWLLRQHLPE